MAASAASYEDGSYVCPLVLNGGHIGVESYLLAAQCNLKTDYHRHIDVLLLGGETLCFFQCQHVANGPTSFYQESFCVFLSVFTGHPRRHSLRSPSAAVGQLS